MIAGRQSSTNLQTTFTTKGLASILLNRLLHVSFFIIGLTAGVRFVCADLEKNILLSNDHTYYHTSYCLLFVGFDLDAPCLHVDILCFTLY